MKLMKVFGNFLTNVCYSLVNVFIFLDLKEMALLTLGSMSRNIRQKDAYLSSNITQFLHNMVNEYKLGTQKQCRLMTIINSIANAADNTSIDVIKDHVSEDTDLRTQMAAIRALARIHVQNVSCAKSRNIYAF